MGLYSPLVTCAMLEKDRADYVDCISTLLARLSLLGRPSSVGAPKEPVKDEQRRFLSAGVWSAPSGAPSSRCIDIKAGGVGGPVGGGSSGLRRPSDSGGTYSGAALWLKAVGRNTCGYCSECATPVFGWRAQGWPRQHSGQHRTPSGSSQSGGVAGLLAARYLTDQSRRLSVSQSSPNWCSR